ncbi:MAG: hypothetical protein IH899_06535, partial [Planctomycetes bacterium]|nr:hypothetical protein [Planctomycetota bacterium]
FEHSRRVGNTGARTAGGLAVPNIQIRRFISVAELKVGQSIILTETGPVATKEKNQTVGKGLMVILSPSIISASTTTKWTPEKTGMAGVVRMVPQPVLPATFDAPARQPQPQDLHHSIRELRGDVRALRRDVGRLLKLLEKKEKTWNELRQSKVSPAILKALEKHASLQFHEVSLADIMRELSRSFGMNIILDTQGMEEEGVTGKTPVTIHVDGIKLKSALNLILKPLNLTYQARDEVLFITSKSRARGKLVAVTYPVAELVIPIPISGPVPANEILHWERKNAENPLSARSPVIDVDTLIETIQSTVQPDSWDEVGGPATIRYFVTTLSLVIRQTPQAHQEIADLLEQLRRLQDMQVTLEARFLSRLPDRFWERIGVDFDFKKEADGSLGGIILTDRQAELLLQAAQGNSRANLIQGPKITLFNGRTADITKYTIGGKEQPLKYSLHVQPVISADRRNIRLNLRVSDRKSPRTDTRAYVNTVPDGKTLLIEIGRRDDVSVGVPILNKTPYIARTFKNSGVRQSEGRRFLLIRPRVVIQEEEEELIGNPQE